MKKYVIISILLLLTICTKNIFADPVYYLDLKYVLNQSVAGKKAKDSLKQKLDKGIKDLQTKEKNLQNDEKKLIQQKKLVSPEEYKIKEVNVSFNMKESENVQSCEDKPTRSNDRDNKS